MGEYNSSYAYAIMRLLTVTHAGWTPCFLYPIVACRTPVRERWPVIEKVSTVGERSICSRSARWLIIDVCLTANSAIESSGVRRGDREDSEEKVVETHDIE
jgi:hypothetical protein